MSVTGVVLSVSPDWRGSALTVDTTTGTTVLSVEDAVDFDEEGGWLVIADEATPRQYLSVDFDADTVTLATAVGAVFDADLPVVVWDPTTPGGGSRVVEYVALVDLDGDAGPADATIDQERVPTAGGVDFLLGATVVLEEADEDDEAPEWLVVQVVGRDATIDSAFISTPLLRAHLAANVSVLHGTVTSVSGWTTTVSRGITLASGWATVDEPGVYTVVLSGAWAANSNGSRYTIIRSRNAAGVEASERQVAIPSSTGTTIVAQATAILELEAGAAIRMQVQQTSGAALDLAGAADGRLTAFEIYRGAVE